MYRIVRNIHSKKYNSVVVIIERNHSIKSWIVYYTASFFVEFFITIIIKKHIVAFGFNASFNEMKICAYKCFGICICIIIISQVQQHLLNFIFSKLILAYKEMIAVRIFKL